MLYPRLGLGQDLGLGAPQIDGLAVGLLDVPGGVGEDFDTVTLGIAAIDAPGNAVGDADQLFDALAIEQREDLAQIGQRLGAQRYLVDDVEIERGGPAGDQRNLMVLARIAAQEDDLDAAQHSPIGHRKAQHALVKALHLAKIMHEDTDMAESEGGWFDQIGDPYSNRNRPPKRPPMQDKRLASN